MIRPGSWSHEVERRLRVTEPVIKFITVRMDEEEKRAGQGEGDSRYAQEAGAQPHAAAAAEAAAMPRSAEPRLLPKLRRRRKQSAAQPQITKQD